jgi:hypothetical protein
MYMLVKQVDERVWAQMHNPRNQSQTSSGQLVRHFKLVGGNVHMVIGGLDPGATIIAL